MARRYSKIYFLKRVIGNAHSFFDDSYQKQIISTTFKLN